MRMAVALVLLVACASGSPWHRALRPSVLGLRVTASSMRLPIRPPMLAPGPGCPSL